MKNTKQAENKKKGDKITFRVNILEDKEIIRYIDKAKNGSGFIKEAIKFYIMALEKGLVTSYYLEDTEKEWENVLGRWDNNKKTEIPDITFRIDDFDDDRLKESNKNNTFISTNKNYADRIELTTDIFDVDDDNSFIVDGINTYIDTI